VGAAAPAAQHSRARWATALAFEVATVRSGASPVLGGGVLRLGLDEGVAEFFAGPETRIALGRDRDGLASPRITALALLLFLNNEATKSTKIYALVFVERFGVSAGLREQHFRRF
jgi:hypothetical protein